MERDLFGEKLLFDVTEMRAAGLPDELPESAAEDALLQVEAAHAELKAEAYELGFSPFMADKGIAREKLAALALLGITIRQLSVVSGEQMSINSLDEELQALSSEGLN